MSGQAILYSIISGACGAVSSSQLKSLNIAELYELRSLPVAVSLLPCSN